MMVEGERGEFVRDIITLAPICFAYHLNFNVVA